MIRLTQRYAAMWASWDMPSRFLFSGAVAAAVLAGIHFVARIIR